MSVENTIDGKDGEQYLILETEKENKSLPQMNRYKVKRARDGAIIYNFPGYLLLLNGPQG